MGNAEKGQLLREIAKKTILELVGDEDTAEMIMEEAFTNLPDLKKALQTALETKDMETATRTAHSLKGVMSTMGLKIQSEYAKECEELLKQNNTDIDEIKNQLFTDIENFITLGHL